MHRIGRRNGGKYDDAIEWLDWFAVVLARWRDNKPITGSLLRLHEFSRHTHTVTFNLRSPDQPVNENEWKPAAEAFTHFIADVERTYIVRPSAWTMLIENVQSVRRWCQLHNPPEDPTVFY